MGKRGEIVTKRETRKGPALLLAFLVRHDITLREAAVALHVRHPALWMWIHRRSAPKPHLRKRIADWTSNEVPESSWLSASEIVEIEPYVAAKRNGTDE